MIVSKTRPIGLNDFRDKWVHTHRPPVDATAALYSDPNDSVKLPLTAITPLSLKFSARARPSYLQCAVFILLLFALIYGALFHPPVLISVLYWFCWGAFMIAASLRLTAALIPPRPVVSEAVPSASNENLPTYSVIVALYKESRLATQLTAALNRLDYPRDRIEILFALEADDAETITAFETLLPDYGHMRVVHVPPGTPRTKPRALNYALAEATGDLVVIYDAEDLPDPRQLREAAQTFAQGGPRLACLQAPLRPLNGQTFIARHFAAEYAVQFDVILPAMHALGLPFPLGGTSNHFKASVLKSIGAWDAYNVTEDADLGLRLAQYGYDSGLLTAPTFESPPTTIHAWIPQRTRWIKGYMQTVLVHTRLNTTFKPKVWLGLWAGVGISALSALCYAPFTALVLSNALTHTLQSGPDHVPVQDWVLLGVGTLSAMLALREGARRTRAPLGVKDLLSAPLYWGLQSVSAIFAVWQLITRPFHWDKTEHSPIAAPVD